VGSGPPRPPPPPPGGGRAQKSPPPPARAPLHLKLPFSSLPRPWAAAGACLPPAPLPDGVAALEAETGSGCCTVCGGSRDPGAWEAALGRLAQAAQAEQQVAAMQQQQEGGKQGEQQAGEAGEGRAAALLAQVLVSRRQLLHPANLLLGQTHHRLARLLAAAAGVEVEAGAGAGLDAGAGEAAGQLQGLSLLAGPGQPPPPEGGGGGTAAEAAAALAAQPAAAVPAAVQHLLASQCILGRHYPPGSTAVAAEQRGLAGVIRGLARRPGGLGGGDSERLLLRLAARAEAEAAAVFELHFGSRQVGV